MYPAAGCCRPPVLSIQLSFPLSKPAWTETWRKKVKLNILTFSLLIDSQLQWVSHSYSGAVQGSLVLLDILSSISMQMHCPVQFAHGVTLQLLDTELELADRNVEYLFYFSTQDLRTTHSPGQCGQIPRYLGLGTCGSSLHFEILSQEFTSHCDGWSLVVCPDPAIQKLNTLKTFNTKIRILNLLA